MYTRDYLIKKQEDVVNESFAERLNNYIVNQNRKIPKQEIKKAFPGSTDIMIFLAVSSHQSLLLWDFGQYYSMDLINVTNDIINNIIFSIEEIMRNYNDYCGDRLLFEYMNNYYPNDIKQLSVENNNNLFYVAQSLLSDRYDFRKPHITRKGSIDEVAGNNVVLKMLGYPELLYYENYLDLAKKLKWSSASISSIFFDIEKEYIRISDDQYLKKDSFHINEDALEKIESAILSLMVNEYVSLINFDKFELFPDIGLVWNEYLLKSVINNYSSRLKIIENEVRDRRYVRGLIVKKDMQIHHYSELVAFILKNNGIKTISENKLLSFLIANSLAYRIIPKELYSSEYLKYNDGVFEIQ